jgi:hypothetical protein
MGMSEFEYSDVVLQLRECYESFDLSESNSTVVVNSKALYHLLPELIPPIDRQLGFLDNFQKSGTTREIPADPTSKTSGSIPAIS